MRAEKTLQKCFRNGPCGQEECFKNVFVMIRAGRKNASFARSIVRVVSFVRSFVRSCVRSFVIMKSTLYEKYSEAPLVHLEKIAMMHPSKLALAGHCHWQRHLLCLSYVAFAGSLVWLSRHGFRLITAH